MNFNIRIQCFKVTPFAFGEELLLSIEQILPIKDTEEYAVSMANKVQDEIATQESLKNRFQYRIEFWKEFLKTVNLKNNLFSNISPSKDNWCGIGIGMSGVNLNVVVTKSYCRSEIYFNRGSQEENKQLFDYLETMKDEIHKSFGQVLIWERMSDKVSCRVKAQMDNVNVFNKEEWPKMIDYIVDSSERMVSAFKSPVQKLNTFSKKISK